MATWDELFYTEKNVERIPEAEVYRVVRLLEKRFPAPVLNFWDLGCGGGRHSIAIAKLKHQVYASDNSKRGVALLSEWAKQFNLHIPTSVSEMTDTPFPGVKFHGVISWDVLQHNTLANIEKSINIIHESLLPGGMLLATIKSDKADLYGKGREIEPKTFVNDIGKEAGVPHHYFDEPGIRALFPNSQWTIKALVEQVITNVERPDKFWEYTPFRFTNWGVLMEKK